MGAVARNAYLHARVSSLASALLSDERILELMEISEDERRGVLVARGLLPPQGEPKSLEPMLIPTILKDLAILGRAVSGQARDFLLYWAHRYELSNLKAIIRGKMMGQDVESPKDDLADVGPYATLPLEVLLRTEDVTELLRALENLRYYAGFARQARRVFEERRELFALDAAVDRHYYAGLALRSHALRGTDEGSHLALLVGSLIDRINLVWLLRYRFVYHLSPAEAYYLLIPASYRLSKRHLLSLAGLASQEEVLTRLPMPFAELLKHPSSISEITEILRHWTWGLAEIVLRRSVFSIATGFAYLLLRDRELRHIRAVVKAKQLGLDAEFVRIAIGFDQSSAGRLHV